ncbi:hypothetical protein B0H10DRAFT_2265152 [Mycena sp. CBHHK59/15]|nr:hypothetical protein B0H10DRAFT_2265152 [Mycena sp. CBHHK59/15]
MPPSKPSEGSVRWSVRIVRDDGRLVLSLMLPQFGDHTFGCVYRLLILNLIPGVLLLYVSHASPSKYPTPRPDEGSPTSWTGELDDVAAAAGVEMEMEVGPDFSTVLMERGEAVLGWAQKEPMRARPPCACSCNPSSRRAPASMSVGFCGEYRKNRTRVLGVQQRGRVHVGFQRKSSSGPVGARLARQKVFAGTVQRASAFAKSSPQPPNRSARRGSITSVHRRGSSPRSPARSAPHLADSFTPGRDEWREPAPTQFGSARRSGPTLLAVTGVGAPERQSVLLAGQIRARQAGEPERSATQNHLAPESPSPQDAPKG